MVDPNGIPGCSAACSDTDTKCPSGGCCAAGLQCDLSKPGFCLPLPGNNGTTPSATSGTNPDDIQLIIAVVASGTRRATASVVGGGNINFGPTISTTSLAILRAIPQLGMLIPSVVLGMVMVGIFVAV